MSDCWAVPSCKARLQVLLPEDSWVDLCASALGSCSWGQCAGSLLPRCVARQVRSPGPPLPPPGPRAPLVEALPPRRSLLCSPAHKQSQAPPQPLLGLCPPSPHPLAQTPARVCPSCSAVTMATSPPWGRLGAPPAPLPSHHGTWSPQIGATRGPPVPWCGWSPARSGESGAQCPRP